MYTLGLMLVTCLMPCAGFGFGLFFWIKGRRTKEPGPGRVPGETLMRIGRRAALCGVAAAAVTVATLMLTQHGARGWRVGVAVALVTAQYVMTLTVVLWAAKLLRKK